jgi:hypothetical protein
MRIQRTLKSVLVCIFTLILALTVAEVVAAQGEDDGNEKKPPTFEHPVVAVFRSYFGDEVTDEAAAYHQGSEESEEGGVGFGVLVKLYVIAAESQEACASAEGSCGVTVDELMEAYRSGEGMGQLFKLYDKPSILGVGHLKQGDKGGPPDHAGPKDKEK